MTNNNGDKSTLDELTYEAFGVTVSDEKPKQLTIDDFLYEGDLLDEDSEVVVTEHTHETENVTELIRQWSVDRNLHTADPSKQALKLGEEFGELFEGLAKGDEALTKDALGDMYVVMTILSQQLGFDIEECIGIAYEEIKDRKGRMIDGVFVKESDL